jgi:hypothetical protein
VRTPEINKRVRYKGRVGYVTKQTHPGAQRIGGRLVATGAMAVTIRFEDGRPPVEAVVPESEWEALIPEE